MTVPAGSSTPLISVCIPNFNMGTTLADTLASAQNQTCRDFEIVIQNNCSTDNSADIIRTASQNDPRIKSFENDQFLSMSQNWNACVANSRGQYFVLLSADDIIKPEFLERCLSVLLAKENLGYVWTEREDIDETGNVLKVHRYYGGNCFLPAPLEGKINLFGGHAIPSQILILRSAYDEVGGYDEGLEWCHDRALIARIGLKWDTAYLEEPLCQYRYHAGMSSARFAYDKLGPMEFYKMRLQISRAWARTDEERAELEAVIAQKTAQLCKQQMEQFADAGDHRKAKEYEYLMKSFCLDYGADEVSVGQGSPVGNKSTEEVDPGLPKGAQAFSVSDLDGDVRKRSFS